MNKERANEILDAVVQAAGSSNKKPGIKAVEEILGYEISVAERDDAWKASNNADMDVESTAVTNNYHAPLPVDGVAIAPGETVSIENFEPDDLTERWIAAGHLSIG